MPDEPMAPDVPTDAELHEVSDVEILDASDAADEVERAVGCARVVRSVMGHESDPDRTLARVHGGE